MTGVTWPQGLPGLVPEVYGLLGGSWELENVYSWACNPIYSLSTANKEN